MGTSASSWFLSRAVFEALNDAVGNQKSMLALIMIRALSLAIKLKNHKQKKNIHLGGTLMAVPGQMGMESMDD